MLRYLHGTVGYDLRDVLSDEVKLQKIYEVEVREVQVDRESVLKHCFGLDQL